MTRLAYAFVKSEIEEAGYRLLSKNYRNAHQKLEVICQGNHQYLITWNNFSKGKRCSICRGKTLLYKDVKNSFAQRGYQLLSKEYKKNTQKLDFICPEGHQHSITWADFRSGCGCAVCARRNITHDEVVETFKKDGYELLSEYKRCRDKLDFLCPKGHRHSITLDNFQRGYRCAYCALGGYSPGSVGRLYYLRFNFPGLQPLYKVGITNGTIKKRIGAHDFRYCTVLLDKLYDDGSIPPQEERKILTRFAEFRYQGKPVLKNGGDTELFTRDVLMLDTQLLTVS